MLCLLPAVDLASHSLVDDRLAVICEPFGHGTLLLDSLVNLSAFDINMTSNCFLLFNRRNRKYEVLEHRSLKTPTAQTTNTGA